MAANRESNAVTAVRLCPRCGPTHRRCDTGTAIVLIGLLLGVLAGVTHAFLARGTSPDPVGLYIAGVGAAVAALWVIARTFRGEHC
jgi:hypothetical protein